MKRTSSNSLRSASWTWHISAPILCVVFLSLITPFHLRLALSGSILPYLPPSWPIPQDPHHPHQTPSLSPFRANVIHLQIRFCQGRVVLQSLCQCLTANKDVQNTWWNHLRFFEIHIQEISMPSTACSHTSAHTDISCQCGLQWNEKNKLKFTQICIMDLAHLSTLPLCSLPFTQFTISPSTSSVWIHIALPLPSWPVPQDPHHPHQTPSLSPGITNVVPAQIHVCQGRVVLQTFCQSLTAEKDPQNVVKSSEMLGNSHTKNLNAFYCILLILPLKLTYHVVSDEIKRTSSNSLRSAWWTWMDLAHLSTNLLHVLPFTHFTISPSTSSVWIPTAVPPLMTGSSKKNHHPHQTPSLSPFRANVIHLQIQVCQGRVLLESLCQCLTGDKAPLIFQQVARALKQFALCHAIPA